MIPVIDLFAGPGGLGEGFSALQDEDGKGVFDIKLSIEKDPNAHRTLTWRSFYRQFVKQNRSVPKEYYKAYQEPDLQKREKIIEDALNRFPEGEVAKRECRLVELGSENWPPDLIDSMIQEQLGNSDQWLLIGGPPCQAYSNVGRSRVGGIDKNDHRVYLYQEYLRIIKEHKPSVFVMENVKGLLSAKVEGEKVFDWMLRDLSLGGEYSIHSFVKPVENDKDYLIKSELFGVPQKRHRVILLGVKKGLSHKGEYLEKQSLVSLESVIDSLPFIRSGLNRKFTGYKEELDVNGKKKRVYRKIDDNSGSWKKLVIEQFSEMQEWTELKLNKKSLLPDHLPSEIGGEYIKGVQKFACNKTLQRWFKDNHLKGVANHESRSHLSQDLFRYMYSSYYVQSLDRFPRIEDYIKRSSKLIPDHENVRSGKFNDRFRVQLPNEPATTVTSHISKDGHYFIHYDPKQCRSLTVREAARIQTFPDNYLFRGSRTQQFHQVGNAVPPYLAFQLAKVVRKIISPKK